MKIGIDASRYNDNKATGVEWYSWQIINHLLKEFSSKDDVTFYSRKKVALKGNKVINFRRLWTLRGLSKQIGEDKPDVLFVPSHVLPLRLPERSVITIHDVAFKYLRKVYSYFAYLYLDWSTKFAVKNASKIIVPSESTRDDLIKFFKCPKDKIEVIYHGFNKPEVSAKEAAEAFKRSDAFKYFGLNEDSDYLLFVGRLESKKNLVRLIKAFAQFSETHESYRLVLAGKRGLGFEEILKTVGKLRIADKVVMPGYVTEAEKVALLKHCKAFMFPSLYEGFGLPILEAFHFGKPVLTSHVSCLPEVGGDAVAYCDPYDVQMILSGMEKLVDDEKYAEDLVEKGRERLKEFSWKEAAKKTLKVIHG